MTAYEYRDFDYMRAHKRDTTAPHATPKTSAERIAARREDAQHHTADALLEVVALYGAQTTVAPHDAVKIKNVGLALEVLKRNGFIQRAPNGTWCKVDTQTVDYLRTKNRELERQLRTHDARRAQVAS